MKSWRLKSVALTWLHGGHHLAPQYMKTGLCSSRAAAKAASTWASLAASCHAMPCAAAVACVATAVAVTRSVVVAAGGGVAPGAMATDGVDAGRSHAATSSAAAQAATTTAGRGG